MTGLEIMLATAAALAAPVGGVTTTIILKRKAPAEKDIQSLEGTKLSFDIMVDTLKQAKSRITALEEQCARQQIELDNTRSQLRAARNDLEDLQRKIEGSLG
jgi:septal ring factor EnvC (AmiA/AmiB activator)